MKKKSSEKDKKEKEKVVSNGSTVQGGSNFGQGQTSLGQARQGEKKGKGSNYDNEQGWNNEALRMEDID